MELMCHRIWNFRSQEKRVNEVQSLFRWCTHTYIQTSDIKHTHIHITSTWRKRELCGFEWLHTPCNEKEGGRRGEDFQRQKKRWGPEMGATSSSSFPFSSSSTSPDSNLHLTEKVHHLLLKKRRVASLWVEMCVWHVREEEKKKLMKRSALPGFFFSKCCPSRENLLSKSLLPTNVTKGSQRRSSWWRTGFRIQQKQRKKLSRSCSPTSQPAYTQCDSECCQNQGTAFQQHFLPSTDSPSQPAATQPFLCVRMPASLSFDKHWHIHAHSRSTAAAVCVWNWRFCLHPPAT